MKKMLILAAMLTLGGCEPQAEDTPAVTDSVPAAAPMPSDTAAMGDTMMMEGDTMARDTATPM